MVAKLRDLLRSPLCPDNYMSKLELLLQCEEWQEARDIRHFDLLGTSLRLEAGTNLVVLEMPGLQENRPSVLKGDKLFVKEHLKGSKEFEGFVHRVGSSCVWIGFSTTLVNTLRRPGNSNLLWDVRFTVSKVMLSQMHRAVRLAHSLKLVPSLFPTQLPPSLPPQHDDPLSCFNPLVASNPEQYQAVSAIVSGASGRSIQLRLTCYLHFPCVQGASPTLCLAPREQERP